MRFPPLLLPGARVALIAPAGPLIDESDVARAVENAARLGWDAVIGSHVRDRLGYLAGTDEARADDLNRAAKDPSIDAIWCLRGGYGCTRLLDRLDYDAWRAGPKALIGYSDVTALHAAIGMRAELVTFHGPTARATLTPFALESLRRAVSTGGDPCGHAAGARTLRGGCARGRLVGGNLALLSALGGTAFAPSCEGAILVLEDVNEAVYRVDRMLTQLHLSGALSRCRGIVLGGFTEIPPEPGDAERPIESVLQELADRAGVPCIANAPIGHLPEQWSVPLGAMAELDAEALTLRVETPAVHSRSGRESR